MAVALIGCYESDSDSVFTEEDVYEKASFTPLICCSQCKNSQDKTGCAIEKSNTCLCGDISDLNPQKKAEDTKCDRKCPGDPNYRCGAGKYASVYSFEEGDVTSVSTSTEITLSSDDVFNTGVKRSVSPNNRGLTTTPRPPTSSQNLNIGLGIGIAALVIVLLLLVWCRFINKKRLNLKGLLNLRPRETQQTNLQDESPVYYSEIGRDTNLHTYNTLNSSHQVENETCTDNEKSKRNDTNRYEEIDPTSSPSAANEDTIDTAINMSPINNYGSYATLDPKETGFDRSGGQIAQTEKTNQQYMTLDPEATGFNRMEKADSEKSETQYTKSLHKPSKEEQKTNHYSHTNEGMYDSADQKGSTQNGDVNAYDHVFGKQTNGNYNTIDI